MEIYASEHSYFSHPLIPSTQTSSHFLELYLNLGNICKWTFIFLSSSYSKYSDEFPFLGIIFKSWKYMQVNIHISLILLFQVRGQVPVSWNSLKCWEIYASEHSYFSPHPIPSTRTSSRFLEFSKILGNICKWTFIFLLFQVGGQVPVSWNSLKS